MISRRSRVLCASIALISLISSRDVSAYLAMVGLNTYRHANVRGAIKRIDDLHGDGVWFITANSDLEDDHYRTIFARLGGQHYSEDNPTANRSYVRYLRVTGTKPAACFCYNETGGTPGGTLLTDQQIDEQYISHGAQPLICHTRAYVGEWKTQVDRCLRNSKVGAIAMEYVKEALLESRPGIHNGAPQNIRAIANAGKKCFILLHAGADNWSDAENRKIIDNLNRWAPDAMASDDVVLVYQNYDMNRTPTDTTHEWYAATESVASAMRQAKGMTNYSGKTISYTFGRRGHVERWLPNSSVRAHTITNEGEYLVLAKPRSDPYILRHGLSFNGSEATSLRVMVKADRTGDMQIFWGIKGDDTCRASRSKTASYRHAGRWQELHFDMRNESQWVGKTITRLRFDTTSAPSTDAHSWIDYIIQD